MYYVISLKPEFKDKSDDYNFIKEEKIDDSYYRILFSLAWNRTQNLEDIMDENNRTMLERELKNATQLSELKSKLIELFFNIHCIIHEEIKSQDAIIKCFVLEKGVINKISLEYINNKLSVMDRKIEYIEQ